MDQEELDRYLELLRLQYETEMAEDILKEIKEISNE